MRGRSWNKRTDRLIDQLNCVGVTQEMINKLRAADEEKMLRDLRRLSRKGRDLEFRGQNGETPVTARRHDIRYIFLLLFPRNGGQNWIAIRFKSRF